MPSQSAARKVPRTRSPPVRAGKGQGLPDSGRQPVPSSDLPTDVSWPVWNILQYVIRNLYT